MGLSGLYLCIEIGFKQLLKLFDFHFNIRAFWEKVCIIYHFLFGAIDEGNIAASYIVLGLLTNIYFHDLILSFNDEI